MSDQQVLGTPSDGAVGDNLTQANNTGNASVAKTQATTPQNPEDADVKALEAKIAEVEQKYERDLRAMKSSLQRRESELTKEWQAQQLAYEEKIRNLELSGLDDDARKEYEAQFNHERMIELENQLARAQVQIEEREAFNQAISYFTSAGIPADSLDVESGYEALIQSGWDALKMERDALRAQVVSPKDNQPAPPKPAPPVDTNQGNPPSGGPTWEDLRKKYETDENVYRLVEQGMLSPSVIPVPETKE